jgi:GH15 family glucan-1,4-alpha-glucosidase
MNGFAPIESYALIGDGRAAALVGRDGSIDWLCLPDFGAPSVFAAILDPDRGGRFELEPSVPYESTRRYLPETNVLETTFATADGRLTVTDALTIGNTGLLPGAEVARRAECVAGTVPLAWRVEPRFDYGARRARFTARSDAHVCESDELTIGFCAWDAGEPEERDGALEGEATLRDGETAVLALASADRAPLLLPTRREVERRIDDTAEAWRRWVAACTYDGPWRDEVARSLLVIGLLTDERTGAIVAAPTTSLPERIGGPKNYDYRFAWVRDSTFCMDALLRHGMRAQAHASYAWLLGAARGTHPRLQPFYSLDGRVPTETEELDLAGYRSSLPVRAGNDASEQTQLGNYGDLLETTWLYVNDGATLDATAGEQIAEVVDLLCELWRSPDSGIWELHEKRHYTESKMASWVCLDRAVKLAERGELPAAHAGRWRDECAAARRFVLERCWSDAQGSLMRAAEGEDVDASALLTARMGLLAPDDPRLLATRETVRRRLRAGEDGHLLYRYSGMEEEEGAFLACSFWAAEAAAGNDEADAAAAIVEGALSHANDVGLMAEQVDPASGELLGNFPQGLSHLAFLNAAASHAEAAGAGTDTRPGTGGAPLSPA